MALVGRSFSAGSAYRYGFNGKEDDKDISEGAQDYGMRVNDKRLGRFLSVDPLTKTYPWYTPYQFSGNKPIWATDIDGLEENTSSTYVYHPPIIASKPTFKGVISISDATTQTVHKTFSGNFAQLKKADATGMATSIVGQMIGSNEGSASSSLNISMTGSRSEICKTWKGTDIKYYTKYSYCLASPTNTEYGSFEVNTNAIQASARAWDPLVFWVVNRVITTIIGAEIFAASRSTSTGTTTGTSTESFVYRFDTRSMSEIEAAGGFKARGTDTDLLQHAAGNGNSSGYVATSTDEAVLQKLFGSQKGYIYKIKWQANGKNVNEILGPKSPHPEELEIAVPGQIKTTDIISSKTVNQ